MNIPKNNVHSSCVWKLMMRFTCRIINPKSLKYLFFNQFNFCINKTEFSKSLFFQHKTMIFPNTAVYMYMWMPHVRSDWSNWPIKSHVGIWYALLCKQHGRGFQNLQILLKIAKKLQRISKIYLLCFKGVPTLWQIRSRHQYKTILKKCCMKIWHLRFLPCGF